ncbi:uncharacterized protein LOC106013526 [Aplysia californica]|uniref:Uncharacterized protein LOC106013526 n=1 Tax=Aplysia californica TaxID=6500 RepID=A0ABM1W2P1_APLCA|nr:uncharacterized protein LOC106013526 [Aplysia californica]
MLDALYSACGTVAAGVHMVRDAVKYVFQVNYEVVAAFVQMVSIVVTTVLSVVRAVKSYFVSSFVCIADFVVEVYDVISSVVYRCWKALIIAHDFFQSLCSYIADTFISGYNFVYSLCAAVKSSIMAVCEFASASANSGVNAFWATLSAFLLFVTTIGNYCVSVVTGAWHGLGFVLSSVAYFPVYSMQCVEDGWRKVTETLYRSLTSASKETYLGIIILCLVYLTFSNAVRYFFSHGLSIFPRPLRRRRRGNSGWHIDRNFESDYEDLFGSDNDERGWLASTRGEDDDDNNDEDQSDSDSDIDNTNDRDGTGIVSEVSDDDDEGDDESDEYTIITEEEEDSDSDASLNSQTFSTESSDHEIDVQLPTVDESYSLRSRAATPSRAPKAVSSPEDFDREMERERDKRKCVVCQDQIKSVLVMPCRHMCMCVLCADQIVRSRVSNRRVCPLCRTKIQKVMNVYV